MPPRAFSIKDLEKVLETDGKVKSVQVTRLTPPGENYSSLVLKADFEVEKNGHVRTVSTVAKRVPMKAESFMLHRALKSQENEIIFYKVIVPLILDFAKENGIYDEANIYPEFCGSRYSLDANKTEADEESVILLKNLIVDGFDVVDRYIGFDYETSKTIVKRIASFHAIPIAMKLRKPEAYKVLSDYLANSQEGQGPPPEMKKKMSHGPKKDDPFWLSIKNIPECAPYISRLEPVLIRPMMRSGPPSYELKEPWITITHNDFWGNNILIKPNKEKEVSVILIDHARSSYDTFAKDLIFFLLTSVQNGAQAEHLDDLLRIYYDEFTRLLKCCGVSSVLSFEEYMDTVNVVAKADEVPHAYGFSVIIFGTKNPEFDHLTEGGDLFSQISEMKKNMNPYHKEKVISIASVAAKKNWI